MSDQLKPCPFCGSEPITPAIPIGVIDDDIPVECSNYECDASLMTFNKSIWNTRPIEDALRKRVEKLENEKAELEEQIADLEGKVYELQDKLEVTK